MKEILVRDKCSACGGAGIITHPAWEKYWRDCRERWIGVEEWFAQEGYDEPPPEEVPCPECDGQGYVMRWVDIATILREVRHA